jgi:hypothetical protein
MERMPNHRSRMMLDDIRPERSVDIHRITRKVEAPSSGATVLQSPSYTAGEER